MKVFDFFSDFCHLRHGPARSGDRSGSILMHECIIQKLPHAQLSVCKATGLSLWSICIKSHTQEHWFYSETYHRPTSVRHGPDGGPDRTESDRAGPIESSRRRTMQTQWSTIIVCHRTILWTDYRWSLGSLGPRTWKSDRSGPRRTDVGTIFDLFWKYECMGNGWS